MNNMWKTEDTEYKTKPEFTWIKSDSFRKAFYRFHIITAVGQAVPSYWNAQASHQMYGMQTEISSTSL